MKQIEISYHPLFCDSLQFEPDLVVVVDILRATSTIPVMLQSGAEKIYPVVDINLARKLKKKLSGPVLLCGERDGEKIEGFNRGNSPLEFLESDLQGYKLIMSSTNGTPAAVKAGLISNQVIFSSFSNLHATIQYISEIGFNNLLILNSGTKQTFSLEDSVFSGYFTDILLKHFKDIRLTDSCYGSMIQYNYFKGDIRGMLSITRNGKILKDIDHHRDLDFCARENTCSVVPCLKKEKEEFVIVSVN